MTTIRRILLGSSLLVAATVLACSLESEGTGATVIADAGTDISVQDGAGGTGEDAGRDTWPGDQGGAPSDAPDAADVQDGGDERDVCTTTSCGALGFECGVWDDQCGATIDCGTCTAPSSCHDGRCSLVVYVNANATGAEDGTSWTDAFTSLQDGIDAAASGSMVWVAGGSFERGGSRPVVTMKQDVDLYGGFAATEQNLSDRTLPPVTETVLDGRDTGTVVIGASNSRLDGFTLTGGKNGAGTFDTVQNATIANCQLGQNQSTDGGAALSVVNAWVEVENCGFAGNTAAFGGAIHATGSQLLIRDSVFAGNQVDGSHGGALYVRSSDVTVSKSTFERNRTIAATGSGGAIFCTEGILRIDNSVFWGNVTDAGLGAAITSVASPSASIAHSTFHANISANPGGAAIRSIETSFSVANSVLWGNLPTELSGDSFFVRFSCVSGGSAGPGNIVEDPRFVDALGGGLRLSSDSPCIDAADGDDSTSADRDGRLRYDDPATPNTGIGVPDYTDMGAFEYQGLP